METKFQFLMVRLKEFTAESTKNEIIGFQFLMVRLKAWHIT